MDEEESTVKLGPMGDSKFLALWEDGSCCSASQCLGMERVVRTLSNMLGPAVGGQGAGWKGRKRNDAFAVQLLGNS